VGRGVPPAAEAVSSVQSCRNSVALTDGIRGSFSDDRKSLKTIVIASNFSSFSSIECPYPQYSSVFIMAQYDDTQIGQFMQESLPRLAYHLDFLLANPDIKIQFGFTKKTAPPKSVLPHAYINFLGTNVHNFLLCSVFIFHFSVMLSYHYSLRTSYTVIYTVYGLFLTAYSL
jgi:hypothetical protein